VKWGTLPSGEPLDLTTCGAEPIHIPGSIQPHGLLLAVSDAPELRVLQLSNNTRRHLDRAPEELLNLPLSRLLDEASADRVRAACQVESELDASPLRVRARRQDANVDFDAILHRSGGLWLLDLEPVGQADSYAVTNAHRAVRRAVDRLDRFSNVLDMCRQAASEVRDITGFDRVMIYRFDADWHGEVIAETKRDELEAFLGLHYPASDIPEQARRLYTLNPIRIIPDVDYEPALLIPQRNPLTSEALDLSNSVLRSVSPIHCDYLRNMRVAASMSISLLRDGKLWGLIACHHYQPRFVAYEVRLAAEFLGRALSWQIASREHTDVAEQTALAQSKLTAFVSKLRAASDVFQELAELGPELALLVDAQGVVIAHDGEFLGWGLCPPRDQLPRLLDFLAQQADVFASDEFSQLLPEARVYAESGSGVLSIALAKSTGSFVIWFRPEVERTVRWAADPVKSVVVENGIPRLTPRGSFSLWKQVVKGRSLPWCAWQIRTVSDLRGGLVANVMSHAAEVQRLNRALAKINTELDQFAYVASHDLKAPLRGIANLSQWVEEDLGDALSGESRENMALLRGRVQRLERLIDGILDYSRAGRAKQPPEQVDVGQLLSEVTELLAPPSTCHIDIRGVMPLVLVERVALQQVFLNLLSNAIKYANRERGEVVVAVREQPAAHQFSIQDNGPGIEPQYHERIWGIFQTLEARDKVEGTGIGLSIVRKIVESRGGQAWLTSTPGQGATFHFSWPKEPNP